MRSLSAVAVLLAIPTCLAAPAISEDEFPVKAPDGHNKLGPITSLSSSISPRAPALVPSYEGLGNYTAQDFGDAGFSTELYHNLEEIFEDAKTALGGKAINESKYCFPCADPVSFLQLGAVIEELSVATLSGIAASFMPSGRASNVATANTTKRYEQKKVHSRGKFRMSTADEEHANGAVVVTDAILATDSQRAGFLRWQLGFPSFSNAFATPLGLNASYSLISELIYVLAHGYTLPFHAYPKLKLAPQEDVYIAGHSNIVFLDAYANALAAGSVRPGEPIYAVFQSGLSDYYALTAVSSSNRDLMTQVPDHSSGGISKFIDPPPSGQVYVILSTADGMKSWVQDSNIIAGVGILEVAPAPPPPPKAKTAVGKLGEQIKRVFTS